MKKAHVTSPEAMQEEQVLRDKAMTPMERLELSFRLSEFALSIQRDRPVVKEEDSSIQWIELVRKSL